MSQDLSVPPAPQEHGVLAAWRGAAGCCRGTSHGRRGSMTDGDLAAALDAARGVKAMLAAAELCLVGEADGRGVGGSAATTTAGWLRGRLRIHPGEASRLVALAAAVRSDCPATGEALAGGRCRLRMLG